MAAYKKQHFLPACYLRYFSCDQSKCTRKSLIWRIDKNCIRKVPVESQCCGDYFYSKQEAAHVEQHFGQIERKYCHVVDRIKEKKEISGAQAGNLALSIFDIYLRNEYHTNDTGEDGFFAYKRDGW